MKGLWLQCALLVLLIPAGAWAQEQKVEMHAVSDSGIGEAIGTVTIRETDDGLAFYPELEGLSPGLHGFHVHENADCGATGPDGKRGPALAAGGHYDPEKAGVHKAPWEDGHKGDLPALYVDADKRAVHPVFASDLELDDVKGRALVIHEWGDNYADQPEPLGGGGSRVACGTIGG